MTHTHTLPLTLLSAEILVGFSTSLNPNVYCLIYLQQTLHKHVILDKVNVNEAN